MSVETSCYAALTAAGAVTALVGAPPNDRIYSDFVPQEKTLPAIAFTRLSTEPVVTIHSAAVAGGKVLLEVWCMASKRGSAEELGDAVLTALAAAQFVLTDRRPELDVDNSIFSAVLSFAVWE